MPIQEDPALGGVFKLVAQCAPLTQALLAYYLQRKYAPGRIRTGDLLLSQRAALSAELPGRTFIIASQSDG